MRRAVIGHMNTARLAGSSPNNIPSRHANLPAARRSVFLMKDGTGKIAVSRSRGEKEMADKSVAEHEAFVSLIRTAQQDPAIRSRLRAILDQPPFHLKSLLNTMVAEMQLQSAPADFVRAIACLLNDDVAQKARELLDEA